MNKEDVELHHDDGLKNRFFFSKFFRISRSEIEREKKAIVQLYKNCGFINSSWHKLKNEKSKPY